MPDAPDRCPYCERPVDRERADFGNGVLACEYCGEIFMRPQTRRRGARGGTIDALYGNQPLTPETGDAPHGRAAAAPADATSSAARSDAPPGARSDRPAAPSDSGSDPVSDAGSDPQSDPGSDPGSDPDSDQGPDRGPAPRSAPAQDIPAPAAPAPSGVAALPPRSAPRRNGLRPSTLVWSAGILVLLAALAAQAAWQLRDELARHPPLRPLLTTLCAYAGCDIPLLRAPRHMRIVARDIRRHPAADDALRVSLTFSNDASFTQAWPDIRLRFVDLRDRVIGERRFTPGEYLPPNIDMAGGIAARGALQTSIEIVDPGPDAVNFTFEFL